jgi:hypothetical protein
MMDLTKLTKEQLDELKAFDLKKKAQDIVLGAFKPDEIKMKDALDPTFMLNKIKDVSTQLTQVKIPSIFEGMVNKLNDKLKGLENASLTDVVKFVQDESDDSLSSVTKEFVEVLDAI